MPIEITSELSIPDSELELSFARSSGPGGQNVNKVNSKAVLHWNLLESPSVPEPLRMRLLTKLAAQLTVLGEIVISSDRYRDQPRNREDCLEKLRALLIQASARPKIRRKTKPTWSSQTKRREGKRTDSRKKQLRGRVKLDD